MAAIIESYGTIFVSLIGFAVTIFVMLCEFRNQKKEKVNDKQRELYINCYSSIEEIVKNSSLVFEKEYYDKIKAYQGQMKLIASNDTLKCYKDLLIYVFEIQRNMNEYHNSVDPRSKSENFEMKVKEETGEEYEVCHFDEWDIQLAEDKVNAYKKDHQPSLEEIKKYVNALINSMRKDFGTDKIARELI